MDINGTPKTMRQALGNETDEIKRELLFRSIRDFLSQRFTVAYGKNPESEQAITELWLSIFPKRNEMAEEVHREYD